MNISPTTEAFIRGIGVIIILAVLGFLSIATNDVIFGQLAPFIAGAALWLEGAIKTSTGNGLFGASHAA